MKLVLFRRSNFHWASGDRERFENAVVEYSIGISPRYLDGIKRWDDTFNMSFFDFRARLAQLTMKNWAKLDVDQIIMFSDTADIPQKPNHLIIPVDDDDWFSPRLPGILRSGGMVPAARWCSVEMGSTSDPYHLHYSHMIPTNGYAADWETLAPLDKQELNVAMMWHASADVNLKHPQWRNIDDYLSMSIKWPSSSESLKNEEPLARVATQLQQRLQLALTNTMCSEFLEEITDATELLRELIASKV